mgnify:CR=1 FL=1
MIHWNIVGVDALIGPPFDRYILSQVEGLSMMLACSGNGPCFINFNFVTKDPIFSLLFHYNRICKFPNIFDHDSNNITIFEKDRRFSCETDTFGSTR